jgi:nucleolar protein 56
MNNVLAEVNVADPTAEADSDVEMADGITAQATEQKLRHKEEKKAKKEKKRKHAEAGENGEKKKKKKSKA